ncbi:5-dehydro-4-deoxyglucarate dehydratase [Streptosporangium sp. NBC_01495]|uniref:5-dehydro-4-deoxyglucarate dehydratase n=1 Tax=Streptosporangium sp. NBC_01495 TaxID=2903899 RepID=UPI002E34F930|nr:5-dehydro-4-deoxyglucarate dehydratase [Streptosporangium sp. NBC_01495]
MDLDGVLFFPVTPFGPDGEPNLPALAEHVGNGVTAGAGAVFAACGTGEFNALDPAEYGRIVRESVNAAGGRVPVVAGTGGALPLAREFAAQATAQGAAGLLLLPPYLVDAPPAGLVVYVRQVAASTDLPIIVYQRGNARFTPGSVAELAAVPNVVGFKDGLGDLDLLQRIILAVDRPGFTFFNGMPTAEMTVLSYRALGVDLYSSAVFCFAPEIALAFHKAVTARDDTLVTDLLREFYGPLVELRDLVPGYAVSLVKAGVRLRGLDAGPVRPPLVDAAPEHVALLEKLIGTGLRIVGA